MDFYIKQNATLPLLKIKASKDGRSDFRSFLSTITESTISFTMVDVDTGIPKILNRVSNFIIDDSPNGVSPSEVFLYIQFNNKDTKKTGRFEIKFNITNNTGSIEIPLSERLFVYILDSFAVSNYAYSDKYVIDNPCCYSPIDKNNYLITQDGRKIKTQDGYFIVVIV